MINKISFCISFFLITLGGFAQSWTQEQSIIGKETGSLDVSGNFAILGAPENETDDNGNNELSLAGAAFIYEFMNGNWVMRQKVVASNRDIQERFGWSVAISSAGHAVIGTRFGDDVYVFENNGQEWVETQKLAASSFEPADQFGFSVAIFENQIVVGAPNRGSVPDGVSRGAAYLYRRENNAGTWQLVAELTAPTGDEQSFGADVDISSSYIVVGAPSLDLDEGPSGGAVYIHFASNGSFSRSLDFPFLQPGDRFGKYVAISNGVVIAGLPEHPLDEGGNDDVGALNDGILHPGIVAIYSGSGWTLQKVVSPNRTPNGEFGISVAISNDLAIIGANQEGLDENNENFLSFAGSAYILERDANGWRTAEKIAAETRSSFDKFGTGVAISDDNALVVNDDGDVLVFDKVSTSTPPVIVADKQIVCSGESVKLNLEGDLDVTTNWNWYSNACDGSLIGSGISIVINPSESTTYYVSSSQNECYSLTITVLPSFDLNASTTDATQGNADGTITLEVTGGTPPYTFDWDIDGTGDFDDNKDLSALSPGTYEVIIRDQLGCKDSLGIEIEVLTVTGIVNESIDNYLKLYPNPITNGRIFYQRFDKTITAVNVISTKGLLIKHQIIREEGILDLADLPSGTYFLEIVARDRTEIQRIVKL